MKVLSLFDGISCARLALKKARIPVEAYYASEIDLPAIAIAQKNNPLTIQIGDIKEIDPHLLLGMKQTGLDLLIGGSPCQDLSIAKKNRKGLSGSRSGLFWEYVRILKEVKPKWFILENVNSMPKEDRDIITKTLGVEPIMIDATLVSAQVRKRLFWTNIPNVAQPKDKGIFLKDILQKNVKQDMPQNYIKWLTGPSGQRRIQKGFIKINPHKAIGLMARDYANWSGNLILQYHRGDWRRKEGGKVPTLTANMGTGGHNVPFVLVREATKKGYAEARIGDSIDLSFPRSKTRRGRVGNKVKNLMTSQNIGVLDYDGIRKLTPIECERLQCLPDNYTGGISNTQRYKALGNAFNADVVAHILRFIPKDDH